MDRAELLAHLRATHFESGDRERARSDAGRIARFLVGEGARRVVGIGSAFDARRSFTHRSDIDLVVEGIDAAAFGRLTEQVERHDDVLPRSVLHAGFQFSGARVPLVGPQGIFKPRLCELPLSVLTACNGPYDDRTSHDGRFLYAYRGRDPRHRDNEGLRTLMQRRIPLIYFYCLLPGRYLAAWPVFVVGDEPERLRFTIQLDDARVLDMLSFRDSSPTIALHYEPGGDERRRYVTREFEARLHQRRFSIVSLRGCAGRSRR